jgi:hypothetical protein
MPARLTGAARHRGEVHVVVVVVSPLPMAFLIESLQSYQDEIHNHFKNEEVRRKNFARVVRNARYRQSVLRQRAAKPPPDLLGGSRASRRAAATQSGVSGESARAATAPIPRPPARGGRGAPSSAGQGQGGGVGRPQTAPVETTVCAMLALWDAVGPDMAPAGRSPRHRGRQAARCVRQHGPLRAWQPWVS